MSGASNPLLDLPPLIITAAGPQPQSAETLLAQEIALAETLAPPGLTTNLPMSLLDDVTGTQVAGIMLLDQARVDTVNSVSPHAANAFLLQQLGAVYGVPLGQGSNATVDVVFTGTNGFPIPVGFTVSDSTYQYVVQPPGGIVDPVSGTSQPITALAVLSGVWPIPANSVTKFVTSLPSTISLTVTNPIAGTPGIGPQNEWDYRAQVLQAGLAASQGMTRYLKTLLGNVPGVQQRLISARPQSGGGWEIIVGGGNLYPVAYAVFQSLFDISTLVGSTMAVTAITQANPGVVTTLLNHGLTTGTVVNIAGVVGMTQINNTPLTITVLTEKTFSVGVDTTGYSTYVSGGVVTPNPRNAVASIPDYPDVYDIPIVLPPQQSTVVALTWNTLLTNFTGAAAVQQLGIDAIVNYINGGTTTGGIIYPGVAVGTALNLSDLQTAFLSAIEPIIASVNVTRMVWAISINGVPTAPVSGDLIVEGDPESYFFTDPSGSDVTVVQG